MNKIKTITLIILLTILATGCRATLESRNNSNDMHMKDNTYPDDFLDKVEAVEIKDVIENQYDEPLEVQLSESEIGELTEIVRGSKMSTEGSGSKAYYKLVLKNDGDILDEWTIDRERNVTTLSGTLNENDKISEWFRNMETNHNMTYERILDRKPGKNYFEDLRNCTHGKIEEITDNNFIEGIEYDLDQEDIDRIIACSDQIEISGETQEETEAYARIYLYDRSGALIHELDLSGDGNISCNKWNLARDSLKTSIAGIVKKSGLQEEQK